MSRKKREETSTALRSLKCLPHETKYYKERRLKQTFVFCLLVVWSIRGWFRPQSGRAERQTFEMKCTDATNWHDSEWQKRASTRFGGGEKGSKTRTSPAAKQRHKIPHIVFFSMRGAVYVEKWCAAQKRIYMRQASLHLRQVVRCA